MVWAHGVHHRCTMGTVTVRASLGFAAAVLASCVAVACGSTSRDSGDTQDPLNPGGVDSGRPDPVCTDGEKKTVDCNGCICTGGDWSCTRLGCPPPTGVTCWGGGIACSATEYCAYVEGEYCGQADATSICKARPSGCTKEYAPVCGCDGNTYPNTCMAAAAGTGVHSSGACK